MLLGKIKKLWVSALIVALCISTVAPMLPQAIVQASEEPVVPLLFSTPEELGTLASSPVTNSAAHGVEDGIPVMYTTVIGGSDNPAMFNVIDMTDYSLIRSIPLEQGNGAADGHIIDSKGNVYIIARNGIYRYSPDSKAVERLAGIAGATATYGLAIDEEDNIYGGTFPLGSLFKYDTVNEKLTVYDQLSEGKSYVRSIAYYDGYVYAGTGAIGELYKIDPNDGSKVKIPFPDTKPYKNPNEVTQVYTLSIVENLMFILMSAHNLLIYDLDKEEWIEEWSTDEQHATYYRGMYVSPELDGKVYMNLEREFHSFDLETREIQATGIKFDQYLRGLGWTELGNEEEDMPGKSLVTLLNGGIALVNFTTNTVKSYDPIVPGQAVSIQSLELGPDGLLYGAGYLGSYGARYDIETGEKEEFNMGQAEGMIPYGDKMMFGVYSGAFMYEMNTTQPIGQGTNPKRIHQIGGIEDRPFALETGDDLLFIGTIPKLGNLGGALTIYDGESWETHPNLIENQSIMGLAYREDKGWLYGSTTVWGGLDITPTEERAKIFVWDVEKGEIIKEFAPDIKQRNAIGPKTIGALSFGPDDGLLWGAAYGTIFAMNPDTFEIVKEKEIHPTTWAFSHSWVPAKLRWDEEGFLYTTLGGTITVIDPETMAHVVIPGTKSNLMVVGPDGNIYYSEASKLKRIEVTPGQPPAYVDVEIPIVNGSFEKVNLDGTIPGWESFGYVEGLAEYEVTAEKANLGTNSLKITDTSIEAEAGVISIPFPVQPGLEYTAKSDIFLDSGRAIFALKYYDDEGNEVTPSPAPAEYFEGPRGVWADSQFKSIAPAEAVTGRLVLFVSEKWAGTVYYDNVRIYEGRIVETPAPGSVTQSLDLENPGFEQPLSENGEIPGWTIRAPESLEGKDAKISLSNEIYNAGTQSLFLYDNETSLEVAIDSDLIPVEAGRTYAIHADFYRTDPPAGRSSNQPILQIRYHDSEGKEIKANSAETTFSKTIATSLNTWVNDGFTSTAQAGAHYIRVTIIGAKAYVASFYTDNVTVSTVVSEEEVTKLNLVHAAVPNVMAGEDVTFTVAATKDADIIVKDGFEVVAQAKGEGIDTPVTLTILAPTAGKHLYEVYANVPGIGKSDSVVLPAVTVYDFTKYELNVEDEITIEVGEEVPVYAKAMYGPLSKDVTTELELQTDSDAIIEVTDHVIKGIAEGEAELEVAIGDEVFDLIVHVVEATDDAVLDAINLTLPKTSIKVGEEMIAQVHGEYIVDTEREVKELTEGVALSSSDEEVVAVDGLKLTAVKVGKVTITATYADKEASVEVEVRSAGGSIPTFPTDPVGPGQTEEPGDSTEPEQPVDPEPNVPEVTEFEDLEDAHWAYTSIQALASQGWLNGYEDGTFKPDFSMTRAEVTTVLVRMLGLELLEGNSFEDVDANHWANQYVETAAAIELVQGMGEDVFAPDEAVTREQLVVLIARALGLESDEANLVDLEFTDLDEVASWALDALQLVMQHGIIEGYPDGSFKPQQAVKRAEVAKVLEALLDIE